MRGVFHKLLFEPRSRLVDVLVRRQDFVVELALEEIHCAFHFEVPVNETPVRLIRVPWRKFNIGRQRSLALVLDEFFQRRLRSRTHIVSNEIANIIMGQTPP
eukprot:Gregarina_sp_Pseudo_9__3266@NODE_3449_length_646_cov_4_672158_g3148_i0_p3_GENE_NODE_3449_length_646_cov_4_672158_g3148_i0NODE_3449_length_646_cov_4_672158_g3148_i0_p3_ORF_typecomplete_len102_score9_62DUF934/PF06073_12/0_14DUF1744/PF08490_12/0_21_NODE_3449_length_646_cov_4_672158_g3148_i0309614